MQSSKRKRGGSYYKGDNRKRRGDFDGTRVSGEPDLRSPNLAEQPCTSKSEDGDKIISPSVNSEGTISISTAILDDTTSDLQSKPGSKTSAHKKVVRPYHSLDFHRLNWETYHSSWCRYGCINERSHFTKWREACEDHLWDLYVIFISERVNLSKIDYNLFIVFVYNNSSRFISEFA